MAVRRLADALASVGVGFRDSSDVLMLPSYESESNGVDEVSQAVLDSVTRFPLPRDLEVTVANAFVASEPRLKFLVSGYQTFRDDRRGHARYLVADAIRSTWSGHALEVRRSWLEMIQVDVMQKANGPSRLPLIRLLARCPGPRTLEVLKTVIGRSASGTSADESESILMAARRSRRSARLLGLVPLAILTWLETRTSVTLTHRNRAS